jgi:HAE1 family hydrophobic/amphiphilic exporter-1
MLLGTLIGVLVIPGLYHLFGKLADGRKLLRDEADEPLSEIPEHRPLPPDPDAGMATP